MLTDIDSLVDRLAEGLDPSDIRTDADTRSEHARDSAPFCEVGDPAIVVFPRSTAQVQHVMRTASRMNVPVVPQGAQTGLAGAGAASEGCVVMNLREMNRILAVDPANRTAAVEPGVTTRELKEAASAAGLAYPPDPVSFNDCTIGGNIATGAGGVCCVKYGVTADYVRKMTVVLADGSLMSMGADTVKNVAGINLMQLFIGSEGTLGIVVEATVALRPLPTDALGLLAQFPSTSSAGAAVAAIVAAGHTPSAMELMDATATGAVSELGHPDLVDASATCLIVESDAPTKEEDVRAMAALCEESGASRVTVGSDSDTAERLLNARRMVPLALREKAMSISPTAVSFIEDVAVPRTNLAQLIDEIEAVSERRGVWIATIGHAGDGNLHPIVVFDAEDPGQNRAAQAAYDDIMSAGLRLGGTITGEHGVGTLKKEWLADQVDPLELAFMKGVKRMFDPQGILNPGKVL